MKLDIMPWKPRFSCLNHLLTTNTWNNPYAPVLWISQSDLTSVASLIFIMQKKCISGTKQK